MKLNQEHIETHVPWLIILVLLVVSAIFLITGFHASGRGAGGAARAPGSRAARDAEIRVAGTDRVTTSVAGGLYVLTGVPAGERSISACVVSAPILTLPFATVMPARLGTPVMSIKISGDDKRRLSVASRAPEQ